MAPLLLVGSAGAVGAQEGGPGTGAVPELPAPTQEPPPEPTPEPEPEPEPPPDPEPEPAPQPAEEPAEPSRTRASSAPVTRAPSSPSTAEQPAQEAVVDDAASPPPPPGPSVRPFPVATPDSATPAPVADTARPADPISRLVQLAVAGALLLLVSGVTGLYLTRESRGDRHG